MMSEVSQVGICRTIPRPQDVVELLIRRYQALDFWIRGNWPIAADQSLYLWLDLRDDSVVVLIEHPFALTFKGRAQLPARIALTTEQQRRSLYIFRRASPLFPNFVQPFNEI